jgi:hypothetical protein
MAHLVKCQIVREVKHVLLVELDDVLRTNVVVDLMLVCTRFRYLLQCLTNLMSCANCQRSIEMFEVTEICHCTCGAFCGNKLVDFGQVS